MKSKHQTTLIDCALSIVEGRGRSYRASSVKVTWGVDKKRKKRFLFKQVLYQQITNTKKHTTNYSCYLVLSAICIALVKRERRAATINTWCTCSIPFRAAWLYHTFCVGKSTLIVLHLHPFCCGDCGVLRFLSWMPAHHGFSTPRAKDSYKPLSHKPQKNAAMRKPKAIKKGTRTW